MILVTGATGFIGSALVKTLASSGEKVRVLVRNAGKADFSGVDVVEGDLFSMPSLEKALKGVHTVIHLAGTISYSMSQTEIFTTNVAGTLNLLNACSKSKADRFIFASSVSVYGRQKGEITEKTPPMAANDYGESKLAAESHVMESGMDCVILRLAPVYGPGSAQWMKSMKLLDGGFPVPDTKNRTHVLSVNNAVQALMLSLKGAPGTYNIADAKPIPFTEFAEQIVRLLGKEPKRMALWTVKLGAVFKGLGPYVDVLVQDREYSIKEAVDRLGYRPVDDFDKEVERMVKWYIESKEDACSDR